MGVVGAVGHPGAQEDITHLSLGHRLKNTCLFWGSVLETTSATVKLSSWYYSVGLLFTIYIYIFFIKTYSKSVGSSQNLEMYYMTLFYRLEWFLFSFQCSIMFCCDIIWFNISNTHIHERIILIILLSFFIITFMNILTNSQLCKIIQNCII